MQNKAPWWQAGIIYQIYPRSFQDSNGDGIGDLGGIISRLDYLAALGVDALWLSPIYPSPDMDFGYDVSDYVNVDPRYGTLDEFDRLVEQAHRRGIKIIMDQVFNHTSDQHAWFKTSRQSRDNPYADWYLWADPLPGGGPPNNWKSWFGGGAWEFVPERGQYYMHIFYREQPDLNWRNPDVQTAILAAARFWLERGVSGFRLDVFNAYFKDKDLRSNPPCWGIRGWERQRHIYDINQPEMLPFLSRLRSLMDEFPETYTVGETFFGDPKTAASYTGPDALHASFDFSFLGCQWDADQFHDAIQQWEISLGEGRWPNYVLNNHDNPRSATRHRFEEDDIRAKAMALMHLTLRGTPFLYYGEEIGMRDIRVTRWAMQDRVGKYYWPFFKGRDGCRGPMQWDASEYAGFSAAKPWLKVNPDYTVRNAAAQEKDPESLLHFYRNLIQIRRSHQALLSGSFRFLEGMPEGVLAYCRGDDAEELQVYINFSASPRAIFVPPAGFHQILSTLPGRLWDGTLLTLGPGEGLLLGR